jgi:hypothetical protein
MHPSILDTSIIDLLEADPRPSFIVALTPHPPTVVYTNPAFTAYPTLLDLITAKGTDCGPLWEWITGASTPAGSDPAPNGGRAPRLSFSYSNVYWSRSVVHEQMVVVGANEQVPPSRSPRKVRLDIADPHPNNISPPRHPLPVVDPNTAAVAAATTAATAAESLISSLPVPDIIEFRPRSTPATLALNPRERPPSRAEAVQSLGRAISDPSWVLPDTTPGTWLPVCTKDMPQLTLT